MRIILVFAFVSFAVTSALATDETVKVGPWTIATTYRGDRFDNCTMSSSADGLGITFVRNADGLLLVLDSDKWKLDRGKGYPVHLVTGSQSVEAKALSETKSVTIALTDQLFNARLRNANTLSVKGEGATLRVPLRGSAAGLQRLEACFEKNENQSTEINPFVAPSKKP